MIITWALLKSKRCLPIVVVHHPRIIAWWWWWYECGLMDRYRDMYPTDKMANLSGWEPDCSLSLLCCPAGFFSVCWAGDTTAAGKTTCEIQRWNCPTTKLNFTRYDDGLCTGLDTHTGLSCVCVCSTTRNQTIDSRWRWKKVFFSVCGGHRRCLFFNNYLVVSLFDSSF